MQPLAKDLEAWLKAFARAVRNRDVAAARKLFARGVVAFGTVWPRAEGLSELSAKQWRAVWPRTTGFDFVYATARALQDTDQAAIIAGWSSRGGGRNGSGFQRRGRATIVLRKSRAGWKAVHTHFSLNPSPKHDSLLRPAA